MPKSQLPLLTSTMMLVQAFLAAPAGLRAKASIRSRNGVLLAGYAAMIAADLSFAFLGSVPGAAPSPSAPARLFPRQDTGPENGFCHPEMLAGNAPIRGGQAAGPGGSSAAAAVAGGSCSGGV